MTCGLILNNLRLRRHQEGRQDRARVEPGHSSRSTIWWYPRSKRLEIAMALIDSMTVAENQAKVANLIAYSPTNQPSPTSTRKWHRGCPPALTTPSRASSSTPSTGATQPAGTMGEPEAILNHPARGRSRRRRRRRHFDTKISSLVRPRSALLLLVCFNYPVLEDYSAPAGVLEPTVGRPRQLPAAGRAAAVRAHPVEYRIDQLQPSPPSCAADPAIPSPTAMASAGPGCCRLQ